MASIKPPLRAKRGLSGLTQKRGSPSSIPGLSADQYVKLINSLSEDQVFHLAAKARGREAGPCTVSWCCGSPVPESTPVWTPQPPLVGIETNPGPPSRSRSAPGRTRIPRGRGLLGSLTEGAAQLGSDLARLSMSKRKKKKTSARGLTTNPSSRAVRAPVSTGLQSRSVRHTPVIISGRCFSSSLGTSSALNSQQPTWTTHNSTTLNGGRNIVSVSPAGTQVSRNNFDMFPYTVQNIVNSFMEYRFLRLKATLNPTQPTSKAGVFAFGVNCETGTRDGGVSYATVSSSEVCVGSPLWAPITLDLLAPGGLSRDWKYCDSDDNGPDTEASSRQESAGQMFFAYAGLDPTIKGDGGVPTITHQLWLDYEIEFRGISGLTTVDSQELSVPSQPTGNSPLRSLEPESGCPTPEHELAQSIRLPPAETSRLMSLLSR